VVLPFVGQILAMVCIGAVAGLSDEERGVKIEHASYHSPATGEQPVQFFVRLPSGRELPLGVVTFPREFYLGDKRDKAIQARKAELVEALAEAAHVLINGE